MCPRDDEGTRMYGIVKCRKCGYDNRFNARYCSSCGHAFTVATMGGQIKKSKMSKSIPRMKRWKENISKAFSVLLVVGWSLFSLFAAGAAFTFLAPLGLASFFLSAILFLYLFAPVAIWGDLIKRRNYGAIVFVCWFILSVVVAIGTFDLVLGLGMAGAVAVTIFVWIISAVIFAFLNSILFDFPFEWSTVKQKSRSRYVRKLLSGP